LSNSGGTNAHLILFDCKQLLNYREEDGQQIEPEYFCPVIPLLLINGCKGIGTGWSTFIPQHNPRDVLSYIRARIDGEKTRPEIKPWVKDFSGDITIKRESYMTSGVITKSSDTSVSITELPIGVWTNSYKKYLVDMMKKGKIQSFVENHTTTKVSFDVKVNASDLERLLNSDIYSSFKLQNKLSTTK
jgi:DNA topoisomerase-2